MTRKPGDLPSPPAHRLCVIFFNGSTLTEGDMSDQVLKASIAAQHIAQRALPVCVLATLGVFLLFGVGFAQPDVLHNAAHDGRHSFAFPCH